MWQTFADRFWVDIEYRDIGYLNLARAPSTVQRLADTALLQHGFVVPGEHLDRSALVGRWPTLARTDLVAASHPMPDGFSNQHRAIPGFMLMDVRHGVSIPTVMDGSAVCAGQHPLVPQIIHRCNHSSRRQPCVGSAARPAPSTVRSACRCQRHRARTRCAEPRRQSRGLASPPLPVRP